MKLRRILLVLAFLAFLSVSVGGYLCYSSLRKSAFKEAKTKGILHLEHMRNRISSKLAGNQKAVAALAALEEVQKALFSSNQGSLVEATSVLNQFYDALQVRACYLLDSSGDTIATSNRDTAESFLGKKYSFRPYFLNAMKGVPTVYLAPGTTSKRREVYYSHPVYVEKESSPAGVAVIESSVENLDEELLYEHHGIALLTDSKRVIFASSRKDWLYHVLWKIPPKTKANVSASRQLGKRTCSWTGLKKTGKSVAVDASGGEYLVYQTTIDNYPEWNITYLIGLNTIHKTFVDPLIKTSGSIIVIFCLLIGLSVLLLYWRANEHIIQRKNAEEALNRQKTYFEHLFENSPEASVILDKEARIVSINRQFERLFEYTSAEAKGKCINDLIVSEDLLDEARDITRKTLQCQVIEKETMRQRKTGGLVDVSILGYPITFNGEHVGVYTIYKDITERKQAEEALRASEKQYRNLVDNALVGIYKTDLQGNLLYANEALINMLKFESFEEMKASGVLATYRNPNDRDVVIERLKVSGKINNFEVDLLSKDGAVRNVILGATLDGNIISGMILDITDRKQAGEERTRLATVVEQAAESVIISDRRGTIQYVNPAFESLSGFTREDIVGRNFRVLKSDKHDENFYKKMWETISRGKPWSGRINNTMKDGSLRQFETTISPIRDTSGTVVNFVSVNRDVTQEVALEAQLLHAQKMEAIGTLAGGIAHDFNNLLQVIQGYTEVLLNQMKQGQPGHERLLKIHRSAKRGADLTKQLLTFSRKVQSERKPLDLNQEVKQVKRLLERTIPKMIKIELHLNANPVMVNADSNQVEQALMNLAVNAVDAMPEGGKILMETERVLLDEGFCATRLGAKPGDYILLSISDTGHGMDREILEHAFEPFYTTKEVGKGTGLGLAMVYGIVKNHDGYILCYSEPGTGTTFKIYLPALEQDEQYGKTSDTKYQMKRGKETVLLVDDEEYIRDLGAELLADAGYKVITSVDGKNGLEIYRKEQEQIDLVILDLVIPGMDGRRCYEEILKINSKAKILIVSGYSANGPAKIALEAGASGFVGKPFDVSHLLATIREILDQD
jgi:PAS domain S-box-containing protein